jgi:hypothetical protein
MRLRTLYLQHFTSLVLLYPRCNTVSYDAFRREGQRDGSTKSLLAEAGARSTERRKASMTTWIADTGLSELLTGAVCEIERLCRKHGVVTETRSDALA